METKKDKISDKSQWIILSIVLLVIVVLIVSQQKTKSKKKKFFNRNQQGQYDNHRGRHDSTDEENDEEENQDNYDPNQAFIEKGYSDKDIKELTISWELKANEVPDLKAKKRRGVINTLAVAGKKGFCSELVIILKKSPHAKANNLDWMKVNQSKGFANTRNDNENVIKFAIEKLKEKGYKWEYDVYVLEVDNHATISGGSAGSGVFLALISAYFSNSAIPRNLAITGALDTEKKEIPAKTGSNPKKYQWRANYCAQCGKRSSLYHFIYDKSNGGKLEKSYLGNATDPDSQWVFCTGTCYNEWWNENVYNCSECSQQRFGNCACCGKHHSWSQENNNGEYFCSSKCVSKRYPPTYEEGKVAAIGGLAAKISAAVAKGCDTIVIAKDNSAEYHSEVPWSVRAKVKKLYEVETWQDLWNFDLSKF